MLWFKLKILKKSAYYLYLCNTRLLLYLCTNKPSTFSIMIDFFLLFRM